MPGVKRAVRCRRTGARRSPRSTPAATTLGLVGSTATAGSFCLFCGNGVMGLPTVTRDSVAACAPPGAAKIITKATTQAIQPSFRIRVSFRLDAALASAACQACQSARYPARHPAKRRQWTKPASGDRPGRPSVLPESQAAGALHRAGEDLVLALDLAAAHQDPAVDDRRVDHRSRGRVHEAGGEVAQAELGARRRAAAGSRPARPGPRAPPASSGEPAARWRSPRPRRRSPRPGSRASCLCEQRERLHVVRTGRGSRSTRPRRCRGRRARPASRAAR